MKKTKISTHKAYFAFTIAIIISTLLTTQTTAKGLLEYQCTRTKNFVLNIGGELTHDACWKINIVSRPSNILKGSPGHAFIALENKCIANSTHPPQIYGFYISGEESSPADYTQITHSISITAKNDIALEIANNMPLISEECKKYGETLILRKILHPNKTTTPTIPRNLKPVVLPINHYGLFLNNCTYHTMCITKELLGIDIDPFLTLPESLLEELCKKAIYTRFNKTTPVNDSCSTIQLPLAPENSTLSGAELYPEMTDYSHRFFSREFQKFAQ